jgi:hypothetical protein
MNDRPTEARLEDARLYAHEVRRIASRTNGEALAGHDFLAIRYCLVVIGGTLDKVPNAVLSGESGIPWRR